MIFGITGNTNKERLWEPVSALVHWLLAEKLAFCLHENVARGLAQRNLLAENVCVAHGVYDLASETDIILSFGGDGTLLNSAHEVGTRETPILGVNIGRLGFLATIEVSQVEQTILRLLDGDYITEQRTVLEAETDNGVALKSKWAVNEFVVLRSGETSMLTIEVKVNGTYLNTYWADGIILATPTGSTAYSLSLGGPILVPGCEALVLTPVAPHALTARPIVLPDDAVVEVCVLHNDRPYAFTADGNGTVLEGEPVKLTLRRAIHSVHLVKLPEQEFFETLRNKLMWGMRKA